MVETREITFDTRGSGDIVDLTEDLRTAVQACEAASGVATVFVPGSTGALTTVEYEPGLVKDLPELFERLVPSDREYNHDKTWHDGNGFSHLRSSLIGPDISIPFVGHELALGTWQQVVFLEFDNRSRHRRVVLQIMGE